MPTINEDLSVPDEDDVAGGTLNPVALRGVQKARVKATSAATKAATSPAGAVRDAAKEPFENYPDPQPT